MKYGPELPPEGDKAFRSGYLDKGEINLYIMKHSDLFKEAHPGKNSRGQNLLPVNGKKIPNHIPFGLTAESTGTLDGKILMKLDNIKAAPVLTIPLLKPPVLRVVASS